MSLKSVLIVDDQAFIRVMMAKALGDDYRVLQASDGMAAVNLLRDSATKIADAAGTDLMAQQAAETRIDCIVSDINMQPMNGLEFVKAIRVGLATVPRDTPVLMLTGYGEKHYLAAAIALDVSGFLVKPVSSAHFRERLERSMATPISLKPPDEYAMLIVPDIDNKDLWASATAPGRPRAPVRAADLAGRFSDKLPHQVAPSELKAGDRLSEDLRTEEGVLVVPQGTPIGAALIAAIMDLSEIVQLQKSVAVFRA
jgi:CheY-like chemotaxis protein